MAATECPICKVAVRLTGEQRLYRHRSGAGVLCDGSGTSPTGDAPPDPNDWLMGQTATAEVAEMSPFAQEIATRMREIFYAYSSRLDRNVQSTLGPSEIGTPCDRRLAMSLLKVPPVNPGGDNWASFVGTCVHEGLARMLLWANGGTGRFATEVPLTFPSVVVPHGTTDAIDRVLLAAMDHKLMGQWSLDKLKDGPTRTYRVQLHTYAHGLRLAGEHVEHVALIGWPRQGSNLDDLWVWTEPYDPTVARDAFARVHQIHQNVKAGIPWQDFPVANDCRYCPFHLKDGDNTYACNGTV